jgi:hypothetical protein
MDIRAGVSGLNVGAQRCWHPAIYMEPRLVSTINGLAAALMRMEFGISFIAIISEPGYPRGFLISRSCGKLTVTVTLSPPFDFRIAPEFADTRVWPAPLLQEGSKAALLSESTDSSPNRTYRGSPALCKFLDNLSCQFVV